MDYRAAINGTPGQAAAAANAEQVQPLMMLHNVALSYAALDQLLPVGTASAISTYGVTGLFYAHDPASAIPEITATGAVNASAWQPPSALCKVCGPVDLPTPDWQLDDSSDLAFVASASLTGTGGNVTFSGAQVAVAQSAGGVLAASITSTSVMQLVRFVATVAFGASVVPTATASTQSTIAPPAGLSWLVDSTRDTVLGIGTALVALATDTGGNGYLVGADVTQGAPSSWSTLLRFPGGIPTHLAMGTDGDNLFILTQATGSTPQLSAIAVSQGSFGTATTATPPPFAAGDPPIAHGLAAGSGLLQCGVYVAPVISGAVGQWASAFLPRDTLSPTTYRTAQSLTMSPLCTGMTLIDLNGRSLRMTSTLTSQGPVLRVVPGNSLPGGPNQVPGMPPATAMSLFGATGPAPGALIGHFDGVALTLNTSGTVAAWARAPYVTVPMTLAGQTVTLASSSVLSPLIYAGTLTGIPSAAIGDGRVITVHTNASGEPLWISQGTLDLAGGSIGTLLLIEQSGVNLTAVSVF